MIDLPAMMGGAVSLLSLCNLLLSGRLRGDIAELKLGVTERIVAGEKENREWAEERFVDEKLLNAKLEAIRATR